MMDDLKLIKKELKNKCFDLVAIGRPFLENPRWIFKNISKTKFNKIVPKQYLRGF